jgi:membrane dipeptidase
MRYSDTHCDYLYDPKGKKDQSNLTMYKKSDLIIQVFAIFFDPERKYAKLNGIKQLLRYKYITCKRSIFTKKLYKESIKKDSRIFPILAIEGLKAVGYSLKMLKTMIKLGATMVSLSWNEDNAFVGGALSDGELKPLGKKALDMIKDNNICLDVSHLNRVSFNQVLDYYKGKVLASHSCCNALLDHKRNLTDDQIKTIINKDGYIGINFYPGFLVGESKDAKAHDIVSHIKHICDLGGINNVGFGSDFCGIPKTPSDVNNCLKFNLIYDCIKQSGFSEQEAEKICYKNFYNFYFKN